MRLAIAGFQHETNTFGATRAHFADFEMADSWPGLLRGPDVVSGTEDSNLPIAGFVRRARQQGVTDLVPIIWCAAEPSSYVTDDAFERISMMILDGVREAGRIDGLYLDLHGAMVTESHEDGEGELLARIRRLVGPELPISISLDLHANITRAMVDLASSMTVFRTYPHLDMADTGGRAFDALVHLIRGGKLHAGFRQSPFLIPLQAQYTGAAPCDQLYDDIARVGSPPQAWAELALGFPAADIRDAGPSVVAYADTPERAGKIADAVIEKVIAAESSFDCTLKTAVDAVSEANAIAETAQKPVVIADVQDNPGAGATSDSTGLLKALVAGAARRAALGMLDDPKIAKQAHEYGVGAEFDTVLGGRSGPDPDPFRARFRVEALSDGRFAFAGQMYAGSVAETGPAALLRVLDTKSDVVVVVGSTRCQCLDQAVFTHIGVNPAEMGILAVKSTVHFRADFEPIATAVINAEAPGLFPCRIDRIPYRRLRAGVGFLT